MAALALLATLVTAMLAARADHVRQWSKANRRLAAVEAADRLLAQWWLKGDAVPRSDEGTMIADGATLRWRTVTLEDDQVEPLLQAQVVRLQVFADDNRQDEPLVYVDLLLPRPAKDALP